MIAKSSREVLKIPAGVQSAVPRARMCLLQRRHTGSASKIAGTIRLIGDILIEATWYIETYAPANLISPLLHIKCL